jgi:hypothetical protein
MTRTPVVPEGTPVRAVSAQLRRPGSGSAMSAKRRLRLSAALDAVMVQMETNTPSRLAS